MAQAITINDDRVSTLANEERAVTGFSHRVKIKSADIAYGTTSGEVVTVTIGNTPAKWFIDKAGVNVTTAFAGTTALAVSVGTTSSVAAAVSSTSVLTAGWIPMVSTVPIATDLKGTSALSLVAVFTNSGGGSPSALTSGECDIYLNIQDTAKLP